VHFHAPSEHSFNGVRTAPWRRTWCTVSAPTPLWQLAHGWRSVVVPEDAACPEGRLGSSGSLCRIGPGIVRPGQSEYCCHQLF